MFATHVLVLLAAPPLPNPAATLPSELSTAASTLISWVKGVLYFCAFVGLLVAGIMMTVGARNRSQLAVDGAGRIPWVIGGLILGSVAFGLTGAFVL